MKSILKKNKVLFLNFVFCLFFFSLVIGETKAASIIPFQDDFNFSWTYQKIFSPTDIPLPASMNGVSGGLVKAIYSPSVVKFGGKYLMFFGVSLYCNPSGDTVARDSVALAQSTDGTSWQFVKYVIEPDPSVCLLPHSSWLNNAFYQANDPAVQISPDGNNLYVYYTSVLYNFPSAVRECGNIGLATFDSNLNLTGNNYTLLAPSASDGYCTGSYYGFSRPSIQYLGANTIRLWFDSGGIVGHMPLTNYSHLNTSDVFMEGINGGDVNTPTLDYSKTLLLFDGTTIQARSVPAPGWSDPWLFTSAQSGQGWDSWYQGSPDLFIDKDNCDIKLYLAGAVSDGNGFYSSLNIGVAIPPPNKVFSYPVCTTPAGTISGSNCTIPSGQTTCQTNITWSTLGVRGAYVYVRNVGVFSGNTNGTQAATVNSAGSWLDLYQNVTNKLLASVFVKGTSATDTTPPAAPKNVKVN
jgi:hypothetical protein